MKDPVTLSDGWSFERSAVETWLKTSDLSPMTGEKLTTVNVVPNRNLKNAISWWKGRATRDEKGADDDTVSVIARSISSDPVDRRPPPPQSSYPAFQGAMLDLFGLPGFNFPGPAVICQGRTARRVADATDWYRTITFVNRPLNDRMEFSIAETTGEWGGLVVGVTRVDYKTSLSERLVQGSARNAHARHDEVEGFDSAPYESEALMRLVDENSWFLNGQGWFHSPEDGDSLAGWGTSNLRVGDRIGIEVDQEGKFSVRLNGVLKCEVRNAKCIGAPLWVWVGLTGSCSVVELVDP